MSSKECSKCGKDKPLSEYYRRADSPDGYRSYCKQCKNTQQKKWDKNNEERLREYKRSYYRENYMGTEEQKQKARHWNKEYYSRNQEEMLQRAKEYRESENGKRKIRAYRRRDYVKEKQRERAAEYYSTEKGKEKRKRWRRKNKNIVNASTRIRRHKRRANGGEFTDTEWERLVKMCDGRCVCCGSKEQLTVDHIVPVSAGGDSNITNIQPLCLSCNSSKQAKTADYRLKHVKQWAASQ